MTEIANCAIHTGVRSVRRTGRTYVLRARPTQTGRHVVRIDRHETLVHFVFDLRQLPKHARLRDPVAPTDDVIAAEFHRRSA